MDFPGDNIPVVKKAPKPLSRRKLATVVRKAITSYYSEEEQREITEASKRLSVSMSNFVASVALKEARRINRQS